MADKELTCRELVELVTEYLEGTLPVPDRARFEAHLAGCDGCTVYLEQMKRTIWAIGRLTENDVTPDARSELLRVFRDWKRK